MALYTDFEQAASPEMVEALRVELDAMMQPAGIRLEWRPLAGRTGAEAAAELAVVTFKGSCAPAALASRPLDPGPLGWAHVSDGVVLPFADIDCDEIRVFLQRDLLAVHEAQREAVFGRALARVVAHELYHVLTRTVRHASSGACKSAFTARELMAPAFRFGERDAAALRLVARASDRANGTGTP